MFNGVYNAVNQLSCLYYTGIEQNYMNFVSNTLMSYYHDCIANLQNMTQSNTTNSTNNNTQDNISNNTQDNTNTSNNTQDNNNMTQNTSNISCENNQFFNGSDCVNCSLFSYINSNCSDICGNGYLLNLTKNIECDDGNNISGDGCSFDCKIEENFTCKRSNFTSPDHCAQRNDFIASLLVKDVATCFYLEFNRALSNKSIEILRENQSNISEIVKISILEIDQGKYSYQIKEIYKNKIEFSLEFNTSFNSIPFALTITQPQYFYDENNISLSNSNLFSSFPQYINLPPYYEENLITVYKTSRITAYSTVLSSSIPLFFVYTLQFLWIMIDSLQISNIFLYININLPTNAKIILLMFADSNLYFFASLFDKALGLSIDSSEDNRYLVNLIKAPDKFDELGIKSLYFNNVGALVGLIIILHLLYAFFRYIIKMKKKKSIKNRVFNTIVEKIEKYYTYPLIIRVIAINFFIISLAICLQLRSVSTLETFYFYNYILALISVLFIILFLRGIFKISNNENTFFQVEEYIEFYSILFKYSNLETLFGRNLFLLLCLKKIFISAIIVFLYDSPYTVLSFLLVVQIGEIILVFKYEPFAFKILNYFMRFSEIVLCLSLCFMIMIKIYFDNVVQKTLEISQDVVNSFESLGWALISFIFSTMAMFFLIVYWGVFLSFKKCFEKFYKKKKNNNQSNNDFLEKESCKGLNSLREENSRL